MTEKNFCEVCGAGLETREHEGRKRKFCSSCGEFQWRNPKPAAGVILEDREKVLLVKRGIEPDRGKWSIPAGFLECDEAPGIGAVRELEEETGLEVAAEDLELFDTVFVDQGERGHVLVVVFRGDLSAASGKVEAGDDAADARITSLEDLEAGGGDLRTPYLEPVRKALKR